jgi:hypothetical protein
VDPHHVDGDPDADPDSNYHPNADPDADSDYYLMRMQIRMLIQFTKMMRIHNTAELQNKSTSTHPPLHYTFSICSNYK